MSYLTSSTTYKGQFSIVGSLKSSAIVLSPKPFLKWVGGKRQLLPEIRKRLPKDFNNYYEPFVGGGAVLFDLQPETFVINDVNEEVINVYRTIKYDVEALIKELETYKNEASFFYTLRELDRKEEYTALSKIKKAARVIYLNKTCFNGLYRVNRKGQFNAPFGKYRNPNIVNKEGLRSVHNYLNSSFCRITNDDFSKALQNPGEGDFVYLDPPYDPVSITASFTAYSKDGFRKYDQARLKLKCDKLHERGCKFLLSNAATDFIKDLYKGYTIDIVKAGRNINSKGNKRGKVEEVLIRNY